MIVSSSIEIYTTVMGWHVQNGLWELLTGTGMALIPFGGIIIKNLIEARKQQDKADIGVLAFRLSEVELYVAVAIVVLFINPAVNLSPQSVTAKVQHCEFSGDTVTQSTRELSHGNTGTTYDRIDQLQLGGGETPRVPLMWFFWDYLSQAFTLSAKAALPCQPDLRRVSSAVSVARIDDAQLRDETASFYRDCWRPSYNRYLRDKPPQNLTTIDEDIRWAGSQFFLNHTNYYDGHYRTKEPLRSFPYKESRDKNKIAPEYSDGRGLPYCKEWWEHEEYGLKGRLMDHFRAQLGSNEPQSAWSAFTQMLGGNRHDPEEALREILLVSTGMQTLQANNNYPRDEDGGFWRGVGNSAISMSSSAMSYLGGDRAKARMYRDAAPLIQAITLMVITLCTPILLLVSSYSIKPLVTLLLVKFSVVFWGFLFALAVWLDNYLLMALQWSSEGFTGGAFSLHTQDNDVTQEAIKWVTRALFIVLPATFSYLMVMVGIKGGDAMANGVQGAGSGVAGAADPVGAANKAKGLR